jgi:hypothetical protein
VRECINGPGKNPAEQRARIDVAADAGAHLDEREFVELSGDSGFGGFHFDESGNLVVTMTAQGQLGAEVRSRFEAKLAGYKERLPRAHRAQKGSGRFLTRTGQFTFLQLAVGGTRWSLPCWEFPV